MYHDSRDLDALAADIEARFSIVEGWRFEYMYPGFLSYGKDDLTLCFTPDFNGKGKVDIQLQSNEGDSFDFGDLVPYKVPLSAETIVEIVRLYLATAEKAAADQRAARPKGASSRTPPKPIKGPTNKRSGRSQSGGASKGVKS